MDTATVLSAVSLGLSLIGSIILGMNHKRIVSKCCSRTFSASLEIDNTTPVKNIAIPIDGVRI